MTRKDKMLLGRRKERWHKRAQRERNFGGNFLPRREIRANGRRGYEKGEL